MANAGTIDSMDGHDGHRLTKGHAGVAVFPAVLAFIDGPWERSLHDLLSAVAVGYEISLRAGVALHASAAEYHSSGAWNALGAAAVGARLLGLDHDATWHALGIAEYSAPRGPMMRAIDHPTMVKDGSGWGAQAGVSAALLAADGFSGAPAELMGSSDGPEDLGSRWRILEQYFKPFPVCRWAHPAVQAVLSLLAETVVAVDQVDRIEVTTFAAGTRLNTVRPRTTEEAQYSLPYAVAAALVHGDLTPESLLTPDADPDVASLTGRIHLSESVAMTKEFPAQRLAQVEIHLRDGRRLASGPTTADGEPESPLSDAQLLAKFRRYTHRVDPPDADRLAGLILGMHDHSLHELMQLLTGPLMPGDSAL